MTTPLSLAIKGNHVDAVGILLTSSCKIESEDLWRVLYSYNEDMVSILLDHVVICEDTYCMRTLMAKYPLYLFRKALHTSPLDILMTRHVLHVAAFSGNPEHIEDILERGLNINEVLSNMYVSFGVSTSNPTPLHIAVCGARIDNVKTLLKHGADHTIEDRAGLTPLDLAIKSTRQHERGKLYVPIVELLSTMDK